MTLDEDLIAEWFAWLKDVRRVKSSSLYEYEGVVVHWLTFLGDKPLAEATAHDVEGFISRPRPKRGNKAPAAATMQKDLVVVSGLFKYLNARHGFRNPTFDVGRVKVSNRVPKAIQDKTWIALWGSKRLPDDARVALGLGFFCGLRRAEITALKVHQFHGHTIVGFTRKGGGDDTLEWHELVETFAKHLPALCPDPDDFYVPLRRLLKARTPEQALLPWDGFSATHTQLVKHSLKTGDTDPARMSKRMRTWLRAAKLPDNIITPHCLRHSFVTNLLRIGLPMEVVSDLAGHANPKTTMRYVKTSGRLKQWNRDSTRVNRFD